MVSKFKRLFEPVRVGPLELKNRIVMPGMTTGFGTAEGFPTELTRAYYEERAKGGCGLIVVEPVCVTYPQGKIGPTQLSIDDDKFIAPLSEVAQAIKRHGAKAAIQLNHGGRFAIRFCGGEPVGPSAIAAPAPEYGYEQPEVPRELTTSELAKIVADFAKGGERAKKAGFDGVEIHAAHGYLISNFLSSASNKRDDAYGGDLGNRARLLLEIIKAVKESVGTGYPVWCRINGKEYGLDGGITIEESQQLSQMIEQAGTDAIHVSALGFGLNYLQAPMVHLPGHLIPLAAGIRKAVSIPVIAVGRISPDLAEKTLSEGKADLIAMGRPLIADPELPSKLMSGRLADVRPCIHCYVCLEQLAREKLGCSVNPATGRENERAVKAAGRTKKVLVVGAGPAGMEAADVAAQRGHKVILCDKSRKLSGALVVVATLKSEVESFVDYLVAQVKKRRVEVLLGKEITLKQVEAIKPDVAVLAVGPILPPMQIPGVETSNVFNGADIRRVISGELKPGSLKNLAGKRTLWYLAPFPLGRYLSASLVRRLTRFWMPFGRKIVIIGGDRPGCELAEFLVERGKQVTVVESSKSLAKQSPFLYRNLLLSRLREAGVSLLSNTKCEEITKKGLIISTKDGQRKTIAADSIIWAPRPEPNNELFMLLQGKVAEVYLAGDCVEPGGIREAIYDGFRIAKTI